MINEISIVLGILMVLNYLYRIFILIFSGCQGLCRNYYHDDYHTDKSLSKWHTSYVFSKVHTIKINDLSIIILYLSSGPQCIHVLNLYSRGSSIILDTFHHILAKLIWLHEIFVIFLPSWSSAWSYLMY